MARVRKDVFLPSMLVDREMREALEKQAAQACRTLTQQVRYILNDYMQRTEDKAA